MKAKIKELCESTFEDNICTKAKGHYGKHLDDREDRWVAWTDAGKARVEAERAEKVSK